MAHQKATLADGPLCFTVSDLRRGTGTDWERSAYQPHLQVGALTDGGCDVSVSIGSASVRYRLDRAESLALAQWLTRNAEAQP